MHLLEKRGTGRAVFAQNSLDRLVFKGLYSSHSGKTAAGRRITGALQEYACDIGQCDANSKRELKFISIIMKNNIRITCKFLSILAACLVVLDCQSKDGRTTENTTYFQATFIDTNTIYAFEHYRKINVNEGFHPPEYTVLADEWYITSFDIKTHLKERVIHLGGIEIRKINSIYGFGDTVFYSVNDAVWLYFRRSKSQASLNIAGSYPCFMPGHDDVYFLNGEQVCKLNLATHIVKTLFSKPNISLLSCAAPDLLFFADTRLNEVWKADTIGRFLEKIFSGEESIYSLDIAKDGSEILLANTMFIVMNDTAYEVKTYEEYYSRTNIVVRPGRYSYDKTKVVGEFNDNVLLVNLINGETTVFQ